jgi:hypothetical protein
VVRRATILTARTLLEIDFTQCPTVFCSFLLEWSESEICRKTLRKSTFDAAQFVQEHQFSLWPLVSSPLSSAHSSLIQTRLFDNLDSCLEFWPESRLLFDGGIDRTGEESAHYTMILGVCLPSVDDLFGFAWRFSRPDWREGKRIGVWSSRDFMSSALSHIDFVRDFGGFGNLPVSTMGWD